ncbi:MAG: hypothetical protein O3B76_06940 [Proteobacteria bacterium]|nr:hypothetical protein [Pseudomonadota bacterium]MDA1022037.1 hypothetical protein [Pseudomonadota bacterium]
MTATEETDPTSETQPSAGELVTAFADEVVVDAVLATDDFGPVETIQVKGREEPLTVRRLKA